MRFNSSIGFSFIEVLVAMTILSMSLVVLMENQTRSMNLVSKAKTYDYATTLAETKMTELVNLVEQKGLVALKDTETGEFDQEKHPGFRWSYQFLQVPTPDFGAMMAAASGEEEAAEGGNQGLFAGPLKQIGQVWGQALRELRVEVIWGSEENPRSVELVTHLIAQDAVAQLEAATGALGAAFGGGETE